MIGMVCVCASLAVVTPVMPAAGVGVLSWPDIALVGELFTVAGN